MSQNLITDQTLSNDQLLEVIRRQRAEIADLKTQLERPVKLREQLEVALEAWFNGRVNNRHKPAHDKAIFNAYRQIRQVQP